MATIDNKPEDILVPQTKPEEPGKPDPQPQPVETSSDPEVSDDSIDSPVTVQESPIKAEPIEAEPTEDKPEKLKSLKNALKNLKKKLKG